MSVYKWAEYKCTAENPWQKGMRTPAVHPDAVLTHEADDMAYSTGNYNGFHCPNCGVDFKVTMRDS